MWGPSCAKRRPLVLRGGGERKDNIRGADSRSAAWAAGWLVADGPAESPFRARLQALISEWNHRPIAADVEAQRHVRPGEVPAGASV